VAADDIERFLSTAFWPLVFGGLAAFSFLGLLAYTHLRSRALIDLCRQAVKLREAQEEMRKRMGSAPFLNRCLRFEMGVRRILEREGLRPAPPPPPPPAPGRAGAPPVRG